MKNYLKGMLFLAAMGTQASTFYMPGLYGNALSGLYNACFSGPGTSTAPLYTQLLQPPAWSSGFANNVANPITAYSLDSVFGPTSSWVTSGLTQYTPKNGGSAVPDNVPGALKGQALLGGNAYWSINQNALATYLTNNSTTGDLAYYNAAAIEYFSARLAMASSAFTFSPEKSSNQNSFLNILYPTGTNGLEERAIVSTFTTAAENLFSWSRYLRNLTIPDSIGISSLNQNSQIAQATGFTLGALETFAGLIIINTSNTFSTSESGINGIQQVVIPSGQTVPIQLSTLPENTVPLVTPGQKGLINPLTYPVTVHTPITSLESRFTYPGFTSFMVNLSNQNNVCFLPVATQVYAITPDTSSLYAVQETADNWANAPVANTGSYFRQVAFQMNNSANGQISLSSGSYIVGIGVTGASSGATINPIITLQANANTGGYNQFLNSNGNGAVTYSPLTVDNTSAQVGVDFPANFFEDKQPWAVVVTITSSGQPATLQAPVITGVVKLNSFDFPLMFAQDPLAQGYSASKAIKTKVMINQVAPTSTTYGFKKEREQWLPQNLLLPKFMKTSSVSLTNTLGIAFSQRDVWKGISELYALTLQSNLERKNVDAEYHSTQYSFAYMFLQALFNGHLYSTTANSLYNVMKNNKELVGETQVTIKAPGVIGSLAYDYLTESVDKTGEKLSLYSLPDSFNDEIKITTTSPKAKGVWPINEPRKEPKTSDWLQQGTPLDWLFLRALMVGRALIENTGITAAALSSIQSIMGNPSTIIPATQSGKMPVYIPQTNTVVTVSPANSN